MNTRNFLLIIGSILLFFSSSEGQTTTPHQQAIQKSLDDFIRYSNEQKWDQAFDLMYPKLFTSVPKEDLVDLMTEMAKDGMTLEMHNTRIASMTDPIQEGQEFFVRVEYTADILVKIKTGSPYDVSTTIQMIEEQFKNIYGEQNVKWHPDSKEFKIEAQKAMLAIDDGRNEWKLIEINTDQLLLMQDLFPAAIMEKLVKVE